MRCRFARQLTAVTARRKDQAHFYKLTLAKVAERLT
jgi:hypothetical protein